MIHIVFIFSGELLAYGCYVEGFMINIGHSRTPCIRVPQIGAYDFKYRESCSCESLE